MTDIILMSYRQAGKGSEVVGLKACLGRRHYRTAATWGRKAGMAALFGFGAIGLSAGGCALGLLSSGGGSVVLYVVANNSGSAITYNLTMGDAIEKGLSVSDGERANRLVMCGEVAEFRMNMVCADGGSDCNILGIIIGTHEVECGDIVEIVVDPAQDGMLFLSATRRQEAGSDGGDDGEAPEGAGDAES